MKDYKLYIDKKFIFLLCGIISIFVGMLFLWQVTISQPGDILYCFSSQNHKNLLAYITTISICLILFLLLCFCFRKKIMKMNFKACLLSPKLSFLLLTSLLIIFAGLLFDLIMYKEDNFAGFAKEFPKWFSVPLVVFCFILILCILSKEKISNSKGYFLIPLYIMVSFLNAVKYMMINTFTTGYSFHHCNAVVQSIYNVHYNTPFNELTSGIYGHYALFLKPLTSILGANPVSIAMIIGIIGFLTCMLSCLTIHLIVRSNVIKFLSAISLAFFTNVILMTYWQTMPIRWFFPSIILFLAAVYEKKQVDISNLKFYLIGFFICSLSILWETETGIFVAIVWSSFCSLHYMKQKGFSLKRLFKLIILHLITIFMEIALAIVLMNIYNLCVGGKVEIKSFFFPLYTGFTDILLTKLNFGNMYYVYLIIIFLCCIFGAISKIFYYKGNKNSHSFECTIVAISLMGLAMLSFFINRTLAGVSPTYLQAIMCNSILADVSIKPLQRLFYKHKSSLYNIVKIAIGLSCTSVLTIIVILSSYTLPKAKERFERGDYSISSLYNFSKEVEKIVPKDTYAIGIGTADIYGMLGWDPQYHMRDFADLPTGGKQEEILSVVKSDIEKRENVFVGNDEYSLVSDKFKLIKEFNFMGQTYGYFKNIIK